MKKKSALVFVGMISVTYLSFCQTYPLSENSWSNPEFVERFVGSYGVLSGKEPQITSTESELFTEIGTFMESNNVNGAIQVLRNAQGPEASAAIDYTLGNIMLQEGNYREGIKAYEVAIRKFPNFLRAYKNVGLAYVQLQDYEKAAEFLVKSIELGNQEGDSFGLLGYCYLNQGLNESALDAYNIAGVLSPKNKDWQVGKATALQRTGDFQKAVAKLDELIEKYPNTKAYYTAAANACISLQQQLKAAKYLEVMRRRGLADTSVLMLMGDIYLNEKVFTLASERYVESLATINTRDVDRLFRFARGMIALGAYSDAVDFIEKVENAQISMSSDQSKQLLNLKSQIAMSSGDFESAVASLEQVIEADPLNGEALLLLGEYYYDQRDFETAVFYYERAQKIDSHRVEALVQAARVKVAQRQFVAAVELLQEAQNIKPQSHVEDYLNAVRNALRASS